MPSTIRWSYRHRVTSPITRQGPAECRICVTHMVKKQKSKRNKRKSRRYWYRRTLYKSIRYITHIQKHNKNDTSKKPYIFTYTLSILAYKQLNTRADYCYNFFKRGHLFLILCFFFLALCFFFLNFIIFSRFFQMTTV